YTARSIRVSSAEFANANKQADPKVVRAIRASCARIRKFHKKQIEKSWSYREKGVTLGQSIKPIHSAGIYVPGGLAAYPSSVLMNAIPARIAGVKRIVMTTPTPLGVINPHVLVAAQIAEVDEVYKIGGAQAVAALAYGTKSIKPVDKIVGPGNAFVAQAKRQVFGKVDIDMIAGPSEILVLADSGADHRLIAADLLSQAEHDENAYLILVTTSRQIADKVQKELRRQAETLDRRLIIEKCLAKNSYAFIVKSLSEGFDIANRFAPEHMELIIKNARRYVNRVDNAGAIFVGPWTPEAVGDYGAGPNHVLPTGGTARFFSPLGVYDFMKRTSVVSFDQKGLKSIAKVVTTLAKDEGLSAHARAVEMRFKK
ncbi:Histidinol dehydrogenase, partial [hydrothermal vent metagenome]